MFTTYAIVTPLRKTPKGAYTFKVKPPNWADEPWVQQVYETRELASLGRQGWLDYYASRHIEVSTRIRP